MAWLAESVNVLMTDCRRVVCAVAREDRLKAASP